MADNRWLWFEENFETQEGRTLRIAVKDVLEVKQSSFQKIEMYETVCFGKMLVHDGVIMLTEYDNFAYHEMIAHVPMLVHPSPKRVLIVGGGDGGTLKEVLKHRTVTEVVMCEIDEEVISVCKRHFPEFAPGFEDERFTLVVDDAAKYIQSKKEYFDVICVDSSDPIGPAEVLFKKKFYQDLHDALTVDGIAVTQSESMFYHKDFVAKLCVQNREIYHHAGYYYTLVPTYPSGTIGFSFCSKRYGPFENLSDERIDNLGTLKYYSASVHKASFTLPVFMQRALD